MTNNKFGVVLVIIVGIVIIVLMVMYFDLYKCFMVGSVKASMSDYCDACGRGRCRVVLRVLVDCTAQLYRAMYYENW